MSYANQRGRDSQSEDSTDDRRQSPQSYNRYRNRSRSPMGTEERQQSPECVRERRRQNKCVDEADDAQYYHRHHRNRRDNNRSPQSNSDSAEMLNSNSTRNTSKNNKLNENQEIYDTSESLKPQPKICFGVKPMDLQEVKAKEIKPKLTVANAFGDSDDDEEEIPMEARMRMRNIGRETVTSSGPNSYGKTNIGFTTRKHIPDDKDFNHIK